MMAEPGHKYAEGDDVSRPDLIHDALEVWAPTWPRRVNRNQSWADNQSKAVRLLLDEGESPGNSPFISTYSFPRGHTKGRNVPQVDTLFIDFDIDDGEYESGSGDREAWRRDLSFLLVRANKVAQLLLDRDAVGWRASLSGHKGVHLFLDFPAVPLSAGDFGEFVTGVNNFARELTANLMQDTNIDDLGRYIDVTSSDLGRLHRVPNTVHGGASESFGEARYCVPVSLEELAEIDAEDYEQLTRQPRPVPYDSRVPNEQVGETIKQHVVHAQPTRFDEKRGGVSYADYENYKHYVRHVQNEDIELEDIKFLTSDRPCVWHYLQRDDKFEHGDQSHYMETYVIRELQEKGVPVGVMKQAFSDAPQYNEDYTEQRIKTVISYDYHRFNVRRHIERAPEFCAQDECALCSRVHDELNRHG